MPRRSLFQSLDALLDKQLGARLNRQSISVLALHVSGVGLGYLVQVFLARWAGAEAYGSYTYAFAWASTISAVVGLGIPPAMLRFVPVYRSEKDWGRLRGLIRRANGLTLGLSTTFSLVATGVILGIPLGSSPEETSLFLLAVWTVPVLATLRLQGETLRSFGRLYWTYVPALLLRPLVTGIGAYLILSTDPPLTANKIVAIAALVLTGIILSRIWVLVIPDQARPGRSNRCTKREPGSEPPSRSC